ncbi:keratin, type II cytoskeletal 2 epidermal-like [Panicum virgatum]|uniref:keratin, type II cytoskeletal 2 epidermal-like n=1 Tax=Panicum virgatum TaxID=38727 RepID=UPI0019D67A9A|nr:keratin, type II cytoskeletal 2 epidermal-like [Panicum virgatum]
MSESVRRGALALLSEGSRADALLTRRSLGLGDEVGRGESGVCRSSFGDEGLLPAEDGGGERCVRGGHAQPTPGRRRATSGGGSGRTRASRARVGSGGGSARASRGGHGGCRGGGSRRAHQGPCVLGCGGGPRSTRGRARVCVLGGRRAPVALGGGCSGAVRA